MQRVQRARNSRPDDLYIPQVPVKSHTLLRAWAAYPVDVHRHFWAAGLHRASGDQCAGIQLADVCVCHLGGAFIFAPTSKKAVRFFLRGVRCRGDARCAQHRNQTCTKSRGTAAASATATATAAATVVGKSPRILLY